MPIYTNSIDEFEFEDMVGRLHLPAEQLESIVRPGKEGETLRKMAPRAITSQIETMHFVADWAAAKTAYAAYQALIGADPVEVIQHDESFGMFHVIGVVESPKTQAVFRVNGSIIPNPTVRQYCLWTLLAVTEAP